MAIDISELGAADRRADELETTEPDFWLEDLDLLPDGDLESNDANDPAFFDAKTDPDRPVDVFANTWPDEPRYRPHRTREEALSSFLETVRRVFGKAED